MAPLRMAIVGAGRLGTALAAMMAGTTEFSIEVIDHSEDALERLAKRERSVRTRLVRQREDLAGALANMDVTVAAVPDTARAYVAEAAVKAGTHYLDFAPARGRIRESLTALSHTRAVFAGCGVSPGLIDNMANNLLKSFGPASDLIIRVGSIPRFPTNRLGYGQIWNIDGLIDEYTKPCNAIRDSRTVSIEPLGDYERINVDGTTYEAFTTAGGTDDLDWLAPTNPRNVTFKTLRYPGHLEYMRFLLDDLGLRARRDMLRNLLLNGLPVVEDDVLLLILTVRGLLDGRLVEKTTCHRFVPAGSTGPCNALTGVAVGYAATLLSMLAKGAVAPNGMVPHQLIDTQHLLSQQFLFPLQQN
ncbi:saccharopine dehydrogenase family protein [Rhizobium daejeonense]